MGSDVQSCCPVLHANFEKSLRNGCCCSVHAISTLSVSGLGGDMLSNSSGTSSPRTSSWGSHTPSSKGSFMPSFSSDSRGFQFSSKMSKSNSFWYFAFLAFASELSFRLSSGFATFARGTGTWALLTLIVEEEELNKGGVGGANGAVEIFFERKPTKQNQGQVERRSRTKDPREKEPTFSFTCSLPVKFVNYLKVALNFLSK